MSPSWTTSRASAIIAAPNRLTATTRTPAAASTSSTGVPGPRRSAIGPLDQHTLALGSTHSTAGASGRSRRRTRSVVQATVATVGMPSRW